MPNWCKGTLKIRGNLESIKSFCLKGLEPTEIIGLERPKLKLDEFSNLTYRGTCWIEYTRRGFVDNPYICLEDITDPKKSITIAFNARFARKINAEELLQSATKHNVDMRIFAFEREMGFTQDIEIVNKKITRNNTKKIQ